MHLPPHNQAFALPSDDRQEDRRPLSLWVNVSTDEHGTHPARLLNLSPTGFLIATEELRLHPGERLLLHLPDDGMVEAEAVWSSDDLTGLNFREPLSDAQIARLLLRAEPRRVAGDANVRAAVHRSGRTALQPERNFAVPVIIAGAVWALLGGGLLG